MIEKWFGYFSTPRNLCVLNAILILIIVSTNIYFQAFCIPTNWAIITLTVCFTNTCIHPLLLESKYAYISCFINGITFCIFIYCAVFLEHINLYGLLGMFIGIGFIVLIPHFFIIQLLWKTAIKPKYNAFRVFFWFAVLLCMSVSFYAGKQYERSIQNIDAFVKSGFQDLETDFMAEKILGMHFIYHTRYCEFDGWRPPKHEPLLVIGMWLNNRKDPLNVSLTQRVSLYREFFQGNTMKFDCSCGIEYSQTYHKDPIWNPENKLIPKN